MWPAWELTIEKMMPRPFTLLAGLALALTLTSPSLAQRGGGGKAERGGGGKSSGIFGGAKARLAPNRSRGPIDVKAIMQKVKELQVRTKAQTLGRSEKVFELATEAQLRTWFDHCDHNRNSWISFSEAAFSLGFSRGRFAIFDGDRDGRLVAAEFQNYYMHTIVSSKAFAEPKRKAQSGPPPQRTPEQLRAAYDPDLDRALGELELARVLLDH